MSFIKVVRLSDICCRSIDKLSLASNFLGLIVSGISIISTSAQQIMCGRLQKIYQIPPAVLLTQTSMIQVRSAPIVRVETKPNYVKS